MSIKEVSHQRYDQTLLHARSGQLTVGELVDRLMKVDPTTPVCVSADGFNFAELDDNGVMFVGESLVIGLYHQIKRSAA